MIDAPTEFRLFYVQLQVSQEKCWARIDVHPGCSQATLATPEDIVEWIGAHVNYIGGIADKLRLDHAILAEAIRNSKPRG
jgi:hypothetical protein